jgi:SAM-dependent methyltransferase
MPTDNNTTNAYSDFASKWAEKLASQTNIPHTYLEKPAMNGKLPDLKNKSVLCVGCGTGEECEHLKSLGATVTGIDISPGLIEYATAHHSDINFQEMDMESLDFPENSFDYVYSSLTFHYVDSWKKILNTISKVLKPEGILLFSTHHPLKWGAQRTRGEFNELKTGASWSKESSEVYGEYLNTKKIDDIWFGELKVTYYNRSISSMFKDIKESPFQLQDFLEPKPIEATLDVDKNFYKIHNTIPLFIVFELINKK